MSIELWQVLFDQSDHFRHFVKLKFKYCAGTYSVDNVAWCTLAKWLSKDGIDVKVDYLKSYYRIVTLDKLERCIGCRNDQANQLSHMDYNGCLSDDGDDLGEFDLNQLIKIFG